MSLPSFTLTVDGVSRKVSVRNPGGSPKNACIWLHGGIEASQQPEPGEFMVESLVPAGNDHIDFGPRALLGTQADPQYSWVIPGTEGFGFYPSTAPNPNTDRNFIDQLVDYILANHPSVEKIFVSGFSLGCMLTWHLYASNKTHAEQVAAYFLGSCGEPTAGGYNWPAYDKTPRHACLWNGSLDQWSQSVAGAKSWADSTVDLRNAAGYSGNPTFVSGGTCCGLAMQKSTTFESGPVKLRRFVRTNGTHVWSHCSGDPNATEGGRAILSFQQWGVWAT